MSEITVYTALRIRTMNPGMPLATAVAVRDGHILEVGSLGSMKPWLSRYPHRVDDRFRGHVLTPGFIDPHLHPSLGAILLPTHFITAMEWRLPWETVSPTHGHEAYMDRLRAIHRSMKADEPLLTWGYHQIWHGEMSRALLDEISSERPILVIQRSYHEAYVNSAALRWLEIDEAEADRHPQVDIARGRFFEVGKALLVRRFAPYALESSRYRVGLERMKQVVHRGGQTTVGDLGTGVLDETLEWPMIREVLDMDDTPFRTFFVGRSLLNANVEEEMERIAALSNRATHRLRFGKHIKFFADGGFFAELMQVLPPGFIDGHEGEWMTAPEQLEALARAAWNRGLAIHIHCTGDMGVELALDILEKLQWEHPRFNHGFTFEHFGLATPEQCERIATLGARVSANPYYVHELADAYWTDSIGHERASQMVRLGTLTRLGVRVALHSDFSMAPAEPLYNAWVAVNRLSASGEVMAENERLTVDQAMRAITIDAAYMLGLEEEIGSIRAGKRADFTVLEQDPWEVPEMQLKDIPIWGTVFEGRPFEIDA